MNFGAAIAATPGFGETPPDARNRRTIPYDYAFRFDLVGTLDTVHNRTVTVSIEAPFTAASIGYGVVPQPLPARFGFLPHSVLEALRPTSPNAPVPARILSFLRSSPFFQAVALAAELGPTASGALAATTAPTPLPADIGQRLQALTTSLFSGSLVAAIAERVGEPLNAGSVVGPRTASVLQTGFRLNPHFAEGILLSLTSGRPLDPRLLDEAFEVLAAPPDRIQFLYTLTDDGTGREFQSEPILNTAGLGTPDGMRPFRYFARPIEFAPRSVIRMTVVEKSQFKGELHVSLQGYKTLGAPGSPTGPRRLRRISRTRR